MAKPKTFPWIVFADGASSGNPGPGGWGAVIASPDGQVTELGGGSPQTTNNQMELMAVIRALETIKKLRGSAEDEIAVHTDSVYVIRGATQWSWGWRKKGWKTAEGKDVANRELWEDIIRILAQVKPVSWHHVRGHAGIPGNERVDEIAVEFSKGRHPRLYRGPLLSYGVAIHDIPEDTSIPEMSDPKKREKPAPALAYLSLLGATPMQHATWAECERRVKGQSGAKFKKVANADELEKVVKSWGFKVSDLKK